MINKFTLKRTTVALSHLSIKRDLKYCNHKTLKDMITIHLNVLNAMIVTQFINYDECESGNTRRIASKYAASVSSITPASSLRADMS